MTQQATLIEPNGGRKKDTLNTVEQALFYDLLADAKIDSGYWNEEELKIYLVGTVFRLAK
ncbi:MAG: hypothetical protein IPN94_23575 [Sphingobacteriales bacterium]|nr:hypothetical protein [Sphingobacteriales bacterium]